MKTVVTFLMCFAVGAIASQAQTNQTDVLIGRPGVSMENINRYVQFQTRTVDRVFGLNLNYGGVLPMIREAENPWQLINPFAPPAYGNGLENVSIYPPSGRPEGIYLFMVRF